jgi:hypothetical protein
MLYEQRERVNLQNRKEKVHYLNFRALISVIYNSENDWLFVLHCGVQSNANMRKRK